jgi:hypothetical protein
MDRERDFPLTARKFLREVAKIVFERTLETEFIFLFNETFQFRHRTKFIEGTGFAAFQAAANGSLCLKIGRHQGVNAAMFRVYRPTDPDHHKCSVLGRCYLQTMSFQSLGIRLTESTAWTWMQHS